jgi:hypothetical protein
MNERIEELMFEAGRFADENTGSSDRSGMWVYQYSEKFAELIVRECARLADNSPQYIDGREILEHFGVKE